METKGRWDGSSGGLSAKRDILHRRPDAIHGYAEFPNPGTRRPCLVPIFGACALHGYTEFPNTGTRRPCLDLSGGMLDCVDMTMLELLRTRVKEVRPEVLREVEHYIRCDPGILAGKPTFVGTRMPVHLVLECLAVGVSPEEILEEFPTLKAEHIPAALKFAGLLAEVR